MKEIIEKHINLLLQDFVAYYKQKGMKASGNFETESYAEVKQDGDNYTASIWSPDYVEQLEQGRKSGKFPPSKAIEQWVKDKGLSYDIPLKSLVFLISRKISEMGWNRQGYGGVDLITEFFTDQKINEWLNGLKADLDIQMEVEVTKTFQEAWQ